MITKRLSKQGSGILSQRDLAAFFDAEELKRNSASIFNKSETDSPKSSISLKQKNTENDSGSQNLQEEISRLNEINSLQKGRCQALSTQNSRLAKQVHVQDTLIKQLNNEKQKLLEEIHYLRKGYQTVQEQRNRLLIDTGRLRNEINLMRATLDINQQQIFTLDSTNRKLIDELNFEKEMLADYKLENAMFKGQLKNISNAFVSLKQYILDQRQRGIKQTYQLLNARTTEIKTQLTQFKSEIKKIQNQQRQLIDHKDSIFRFIRMMELKFESTRTQLTIAKTLGGSFDESSKYNNQSVAFRLRQEQFHKTIENQENTIKSLSTEITALKKKNAELVDQLNSATYGQVRNNNFHTNTAYVNKLIKQNNRDIQEIKQVIQIKDKQIQRLKQTIQLERSSSINKSEEIQRLQILIKIARNQSYGELNNQIDELKNQKVRLNRRIQQLSQTQMSLKNQIVEKDRIILNYVQKAKGK